jgi:LemA protein
VTTDLAVLVALVLGGILVGFLGIVTYNHVIGLQRRCQRAWANIDVVLKQRHDQLPNLVAAVRSQLGFEQRVLTEVSHLRAAYSPDASVAAQAALSEATSGAVRSLFGVVEGYPDLRSQENVMALQQEIERLETLIARRVSSSTSRCMRIFPLSTSCRVSSCVQCSAGRTSRCSSPMSRSASALSSARRRPARPEPRQGHPLPDGPGPFVVRGSHAGTASDGHRAEWPLRM